MHKKSTTPSAEMALSNTQLLKKGAKPNANTKIRKRHWFAGTLIILTGSWITHTTTASIANPKLQQNLAQMSVSSINESMLNAPQALLTQSISEAKNLIIENDIDSEFLNVDTSKIAAKTLDKVSEDSIIEVLENDIVVSSVDSEHSNKVIADNFKRVSHKVKKGDSLGGIFRKKGYDLRMPYKISQLMSI